jgi:hypothetical protein
MAIDIQAIKFNARIPEIASTVQAVAVSAPGLEERRGGMERLAGPLRLGRLRPVETDTSLVMASRGGDVEYFHASGAVWARNLSSSEAFDNELRKWPDLTEARDATGEPVLTLGEGSAKAASEMARRLADEAGFDLSAAESRSIDLIQVAQLSERGEIMNRGGGEATVGFSYAIEGVPVIGPGGKTSFDFNPDPDDERALQLVGAFHVWRRPERGVKVEIGSAEAVLAAGFLQDPELIQAVEKGGQITVAELRFGLLALPAPMRQGHLFPAIAVTGRVDLPEGKLDHFLFGRYCHAATPEAYEAAGIAADYLSRPN